MEALAQTVEQSTKELLRRGDCRYYDVEGPGHEAHPITALQAMAMFPIDCVSSLKPDADIAAIRHWLQRGLSPLPCVPEPAANTCQWIYGDLTWKRWYSSIGKAALLITAAPGRLYLLNCSPNAATDFSGSGKSVLAHSIVQKAREDANWTTLSFSFGSTIPVHNSRAASFVITILANLLEHDAVISHTSFHSILRNFVPLINHWQDVNQCPLEQLLPQLDLVVCASPRLLIVVDALDEWAAEPLAPLDLLRALANHRNVKMLAFSRDHWIPEDAAAGFERICVDEAEVKTDIGRFVDQRLSTSRYLLKSKEDIRAKVEDGCHGIFLWARLLIDHLDKPMTVKAQRAILADFPLTMSDAYQRLLDENTAHLTAAESDTQRNLLLIISGAREPLTADEVFELTIINRLSDEIDEDARHNDPATEIVRLCCPLVKVVAQNRVQLIHKTVTEFLMRRENWQADSNLYLARRCLSKLIKSEYQSWKVAANLLRKHLLAGTIYQSNPESGAHEAPADSTFYTYAALHFHEHLTALADPPEDIIAKLDRFLTSNAFVSWSEVLFDLRQRLDLGPQLLVYKRLLTWTHFLPPELQVEIPIEAFFEKPHRQLSAVLKEVSEDKVLQYLPEVRTGQYFNTSGQTRGDWQKAFEYKTTVVEGFTALLGARSPVTLRFRTDWFQEFFWQKRFLEARNGLQQVASIQKEVLGIERNDLYVTLSLHAYSEACLTRYAESLMVFRTSTAGFRHLLGELHPLYLMNEFYNGLPLEHLNRLDEARVLYQDILDNWIPVVGSLVNPLALMAKCALGSVQRKQGELELAKQTLLEAYGGRLEMFPIDLNICLDTAIQLALLYRDAGNAQVAIDLLNSVADSKVYEQDFERDCQTQHIRALAFFDMGQYDWPKASLEKLLQRATGTQRDENNRELLWVRLTLADVMRQHGESDEALMLFDELVEPEPPLPPSSRGILREELEPPKQLRLAEKALRLVREAKPDRASDLLRENGLRWVREQDFWVLGQGGPLPDTATIRPVVLGNVEAASQNALQLDSFASVTEEIAQLQS